MPRKLTFSVRRRTFEASPVKIDRRKLYGWTEIEATDDAGAPCAVVTADETGRLILPRGGTAVGLLSPRGEWVERSELKMVTEEGAEAELLPSSYSVTVALRDKATPEQLLDHDITDFYALRDATDEFVRAVGENIYTFDYCYTEGCEGSPAFVLAAQGTLYILVGRRLIFEMTGYDEPEFIDEDPDDDALPEDGEVDFAMF